jgi:hypothetical protein
MKIMNETVYDSDDLMWVIEHAQEKAYEQSIALHAQHGRGSTPPAKPPLPETIRFGYYSAPGVKKGSTELSYVSHRGGGYRSSKIRRIGLVRPTDLPLVAMEIVARAASDRSKRTLPAAVMVDLVKVLVRGVFGSWTDEEADKRLLVGCPAVHYNDSPDHKSASESKTIAREQSLANAERRVQWTEASIKSLEAKLVKTEERLVRHRARLAKLRARKEMSYV